MKVLITGATGFVGGSIMQQMLVDENHSLVAAVRDSQNMRLTGVRVVEVDGLGAETDWTAALQDIDAVVHAAARVHVMKEQAGNPLMEFRRINVDGTLNLARQAAASGVKRFIYISSVKVNGESSDVSNPFASASIPRPQDPYGISKMESEQVLSQISLETSMELVIIRPPLVYGPGVGANFLRLVNAVYRGIPLPFASINNQRSLIGIGNLVDAVIVCLSHPEAKGKTYLVCDKENISTPELITRLARALDCPARLVPFPLSLMKLGARTIGKSQEVDRLIGSLVVDSSEIQDDLSWTPPYSMQQGLEIFADWYLTNCRK